MSEGLITNRPLQNEMTGIDLHVPLHQEIRGAMMTGHVEYQIIVVTRLAAFKSPKHKQGDIVQLVVPKKYSEIDEFYQQLSGKYPKISLPAMPRKALFVGEADIRERRLAFDELVKFISRNSALAGCPEVLEFLGAKLNGTDSKSRNTGIAVGEDTEQEDNVSFFHRDVTSSAAPRDAVRPNEEEEEEEEEAGGSEEQYLGPLGNVKRKSKKTRQPAMAKSSLFGDNKRDLKLFEDPDLGGAVKLGDSLLLPTAYDEVEPSAGSAMEDDMDELFRIEDDFDKLLQVKKSAKSKPTAAPTTKPALPEKPSSQSPGGVKAGGPEKPSSQSPGGTSAGGPTAARLKDQRDILMYIQENEATASDDLDLF